MFAPLNTSTWVRRFPTMFAAQKWGEQESPRNMMPLPLEPAESMKHYVVPEGFELEALCRRARDRGQADLHELGRARTTVGGRDVRLSQRKAAGRARDVTEFAFAKTPTATAKRTSLSCSQKT